MKLLFVSRSTPFHWLGGMEIVAWNLARQLHERGHEVHFLTTQAPALPEFGVIDGIPIRTLNARSGRYSRKWWKLSAEAFRYHYAGTVDLVLGISGGAHTIVGECNAKSWRTPAVMQVHGTAWAEIVSKFSVPNPLMWAAAGRIAFNLLRAWPRNHRPGNHYAHIIPIGPEVVKQLSSAPMRWFQQTTPFTLIENGIDEQKFRFDSLKRETVRRKLNIPEDVNVIISINRLSFQKGCRNALRAMMQAMASAKDLHYLVAGEGPALPLLRSTVAGSGFGGNVHFLGAVDRREIPDILSAADVFLFPSLRQEGLAIAPLEAAANGLRCILSRHIVPPELVCSPVNPRKTSEIAAAILSAATMPRETLSLLPQRYLLRSSVEKYERLLLELVNENRQSTNL